MAKRGMSVKQTTTRATSITASSAANTDDAMEQRVMAFAEEVGRIVGTVQARTEGWMDRDALNRQIVGVRDSATALLEEMKAGVARVTGGEAEGARKVAGARSFAKNKGRSGGVVDAPGKKHRKPMPSDPRALAAGARASNIRSGKASMKTMKRRGRG